MGCGCEDMNWKFGVGAMWFYALDSAMDGTIDVRDTLISDSPFNAIGVIGNSVSGLAFDNITVNNVGTFVLQLQCGGSGTFNNVHASGIGFAPIYDCGVPFSITDQGGSSSWLTHCTDSANCTGSGGSSAATNTCQGKPGAGEMMCAHCGWPTKL